MNRLNQDLMHLIEMSMPQEDIRELSRTNKHISNRIRYQTRFQKLLLEQLLKPYLKHFENLYNQLREALTTMTETGLYTDIVIENDIVLLEDYLPRFTRDYLNYKPLTRMDKIQVSQLLSALQKDYSNLKTDWIKDIKTKLIRNISIAFENPFVREQLYKIVNGNTDIQPLYEVFNEVFELFMTQEQFVKLLSTI